MNYTDSLAPKRKGVGHIIFAVGDDGTDVETGDVDFGGFMQGYKRDGGDGDVSDGVNGLYVLRHDW